MKKLFFIAAMAGAALVSCTKNEPAPFESEQQITFAAPVVGLNTKAVNEVWNNYPTDAAYDFVVWGYYYAGGTYTAFADGQPYMNNVTVSYDGTLSGWAPATSYYWPKNGSLTFIAYSPATLKATEDITVTKAGIQIEDYTVDADAAKQVDLLFSERAYNKKSVDDDFAGSGETDKEPSVTDDRYAGVHLSFKHALSSILFTARTKGTYTGTTITLKEISLLNVKSSGTFNQTLKDANGETTAANVEVWAGQSEPEDYVISGLNQILDANKVDEIITIASIVQEEATSPEMARVSSVLHNRLDDGMQLQCDVTIAYLKNSVMPYLDGDVERYNAYYNTYKCPALPTGPICSPGMDAVIAALNPAYTDYLFFVTDKADPTVFYYSGDYDEHLKNCETAGW